MSTATVTLSTKGQVVFPKDIHDALHWEAGTELTAIPAGDGVMLKAVDSTHLDSKNRRPHLKG